MFEAALAYAKQRETLRQADRQASGRSVTSSPRWRPRSKPHSNSSTKPPWQVNNGEYPVREISMAKLITGEVAWKVADKAMQIFGGYGYSMEFPIQRAWRDSRLIRIGGGTDEIMREVIGRMEGL